MGSLILENRLSSSSASSAQKPSLRRHTLSTNLDSISSRISILAAATPPSPITMDHRHYGRPSSPGGRKIANPERYSAGNLGSYDPYNSTRSSREYISPRTSGDRVIVPHSPQHAAHPSSSSNSTISRSSAGYDAYSGRPRRSTLEGDSRRPANLSLSSRHRPAVIHANDNRPSSPLSRTYDDRDRGRESYVAQPTSAPRREHKKVYSVDDGQSRLIDERDIEPRREPRPAGDRSSHKSTHVGGSRQQYYPAAPAPPRDNEEYYSYTDPAKMYSETEPSWRPRRGSVGKGSRPSSVIIEPSAAPRITREYGPPPSTRGFDRINGGVSRTGSARDPHKRTSSRERERQNPHTTVYRDNIPDPYILPQDVPPRSNSAIPAPRALQETRDDGRGHRDYDDRRDGRHHQRRLTYEDSEVAARGFGIRSGSVDRYAREPSLDRTPMYAAAATEAPIAIPNPRDYLPAESLPPIPPPVRDSRDGRREHDRVDREWPGEPDRERDRDRDYRDKHRDHKDRERERDRDRDRDRDRPRDRDRERDYVRDDKDRDRDRDRYTERDDRIRTKDQDDRHHHKDFIPAVAVAGTAAAAAYGSHSGDRKGRDDRRDDRRYDDDRRSGPDDRRPPPIAAPVDHRPLAPLEERRAPPPADEWGVNVDERRSTAIPPIASTDRRAPPDDRRAPPDDRRAPLDDRRALADDRRPPAVAPIDARAPHDDRRGPPPDEYRGPVDRKAPLPDGRSRPAHKLSSESINAPRERHYVDKDSEREIAARQDSKKSEQLDPDEDYRRRLQAVQADLQRSSTAPPPRERDPSDSDRDRRRRDYDSDQNLERTIPTPTPTSSLPKNVPGSYPTAAAIPARDSNRDFRDREAPSRAPPQSDRSIDRSNNALFGAPLVKDPEEYSDRLDQQERDGRVQIVAPPKGSPPAPKGILRRPTAKFPEDPNPIREGVAPLKDAKKGKDIPINARWTKIDRRLVNPEALKEAKERFEERLDCVIVLRVLSKEDIQKLADRTRDIRERREEGDRDDDRYHEHDRDDDRPRERHRRREKKRDGYDDETESDFYSDEYEDRERRDRDRDHGREHRRDAEAPATTAA